MHQSRWRARPDAGDERREGYEGEARTDEDDEGDEGEPRIDEVDECEKKPNVGKKNGSPTTPCSIRHDIAFY